MERQAPTPSLDPDEVRARSRVARERSEALRSDAAEVVARARETALRVREVVSESPYAFVVRSSRQREGSTSDEPSSPDPPL